MSIISKTEKNYVFFAFTPHIRPFTPFFDLIFNIYVKMRNKERRGFIK